MIFQKVNCMKPLDLLRKLGVVRYGTKSATFTNGRDRPIELMDSGVFNADKELTTKADIKNLMGGSAPAQPPPMPGGAKCPQCGMAIAVPAKFCTGCGARLQAVVPPVTVQPPALMPIRKKNMLPMALVALGIGGFLAVMIWVAIHKLGQGDKRGIVRIGKTEIELPRPTPVPVPEKPMTPVRTDAGNVAMPPATAGGQVSGMKYDLYRNPKFGFLTELPAHWESKVKNNAHVFSGPQGSEDFQTTINFQFIPRQGQSARALAEELVAQWRKMEGFELLDHKRGECFGQPCQLLVARYKLPAGELFQQQQLVIERDPYFYLIAFTAPPELFAKYSFVMNHLMETYKFTAPAAAGQ